MNQIKNFAKKVWMIPADISFSILSHYLSGNEQRFFDIILRSGMKKLEEKSSYFMSYNLRPKHSEKVICIEEKKDYQEVGIVIQGPLEEKENFTLETIKLYKKIFPKAHIIVSCWEDEKKSVIDKINKRGGVECLQNQYPENPGFCNLNLQICSTMSGIRKAKELGAKYVLKTRSDMRIYQIGALDFLINVIERFPVEDNRLNLEKRIVTADFRCLGTQFWPFFLGDQWSFGIVDDMIKYWDMASVENGEYSATELQSKDKSGRSLFTRKERTEKHLLAEGNIVIEFWKRQLGEEPEISINNYWDFVRKYVVVVDRRMLDFYWYKYNIRFEENLHNGSYNREDSSDKYCRYTWNYLNWYNLYCRSMEYDRSYEKLCETNYY